MSKGKAKLTHSDRVPDKTQSSGKFIVYFDTLSSLIQDVYPLCSFPKIDFMALK